MKKFIRLTALFLLPFVLFYGLMGLMLDKMVSPYKSPATACEMARS